MKISRKKIIVAAIAIFITGILLVVVMIFFDEAILMRQGTFYQGHTREKVVALTFDDGPSEVWTPRILDVLRNEDVKATFFLIGNHVTKYPDIVRRIAAEGHDIGNHTNRHPLLYFLDGGALKKEIATCQKAIRETTGVTTNLFRPPKAWLTPHEKRKIQRWGYRIILWTLNSKDWVEFDAKYIVRFIVKNVQPGDIILFHDSGGAFRSEGGGRQETVIALQKTISKLREQGYRFVTITELLKMENQLEHKQNP